MKKLLKPILLSCALAATSLTAVAQSAVKIVVIDMAMLFNNHYSSVDFQSKLNADQKTFQEQITQLEKEFQGVQQEVNDLADQAKNPALTADARAKVEADLKLKYEDYQRRLAQGQDIQENQQRLTQDRIRKFRDALLKEISMVVTGIAKKKGATIVLDKSALALNGGPTLLYSDPSYDITDEVMAEINKNRPPAPPAAVAPATTPAASSSATPPPAPAPATPKAGASNTTLPPTITVPGLAPAKQP